MDPSVKDCGLKSGPNHRIVFLEKILPFSSLTHMQMLLYKSRGQQALELRSLSSTYQLGVATSNCSSKIKVFCTIRCVCVPLWSDVGLTATIECTHRKAKLQTKYQL